MGFDTMFHMMNILFPLTFLLVFGVILTVVIRGIGTWHKNNKAPRLSVAAVVVSRREDVRSHHSGGEHSSFHHSTSYYVTFQVESGDRLEFLVHGHEYGMIAEGDMGRLTFQGTRYLSFERMK